MAGAAAFRGDWSIANVARRRRRSFFYRVLSGEKGIRKPSNTEDASNFAANRKSEPSSADHSSTDNSADARTVASSMGHADAVEIALAKALEGATAEGKWEIVGQLARELESRRLARAGNVVTLKAERARRR
jgi:hypothetical protein